ncbi:Benzyl alcohol O-benzoyltransferase [Linum grandiflorum]
MFALSELACGAITLSILPVWERHIFTARSPPRVTCTHREYENVMVAADSMIINKLDDQMEHRSFYFGLVEISALRSHAPPHLRNSNSHIELITACAWKCRTILPLNLTLTMSALAYPAVVATADDLCRNSLGYALDLVKKAKLEVTVEYMRSVADFMVMTGRRCKYTRARSFSVSDVTRAGYDEVDFGWGKAAYRRPVRGSTSDSSKLLRFVEEGEKMTTLLPITLLKS